MFNDIEARQRLDVFTGGTLHPLLSGEANCRFRAVHDFHGHYVNRYQFGPHGEFLAWRYHCRMFSELARHALTLETLGQGSWFFYGPASYLPIVDRPFAEQKATVLPFHLWKDLL